MADQTKNLQEEEFEDTFSENDELDLQEEESETDAKIASELAEMKQKYLRLYADFENFRKRTLKEKLDLQQTAAESTLKSFLGVVDDFERAMESINQTDDLEALREGVTLIYNKFNATLGAQGVQPMNAKGEAFDADLHEAITHYPAGEENKGLVVDEITKGYYLNDKVLRFAKVVVGS